MKEILCPTCNVELMEHEAKMCLDRWVASALGLEICSKDEAISKSNAAFPGRPTWDDWYAYDFYVCAGPIPPSGLDTLPSYSIDTESAFDLMEKVWEMDPSAFIGKEMIGVEVETHFSNYWPIQGPTFPLRVCRAFLWLKNQGK